jgi:hypothetical protein
MSLERFFAKLRQWGRPWTAGSEPVEIHRALLEDIEAQVVAIGGGRRVFPFDRVEVRLLAPTAAEKLRLEAIAHQGWELEREVRERLAGRGARVPAALAVSVAVTTEPSPEFAGRRYAIAFRHGGAGGEAGESPAPAEPAVPAAAAAPGVPAAPATPATPAASAVPSVPAVPGAAALPPLRAAAARPLLVLAVLKGKATRDSYDFAAADRVFLGRLEEVLDAAGRVMRRNHVAFLEEGEINQTVSREHARIAWEAESQSFWVRDEGSASGTLLFRAGRSIEVSRHDRRGVRLTSGDEIYLGRAAVRVEIGEALPEKPRESSG